MKQLLTLLFTITFTTTTFCQISFEKGYFINTVGIKTDCLIKNIDWSNTPKTFEYKLSDESKVIQNTIRFVKEFGIYGSAKYIKYTVDIAPQTVGALSEKRAPQYLTKTVFLKTLIEGKANLYLYKDTDSKKFFYSLNKETPIQLIYKRYKADEVNIGTNNYFRQQLINTFKCDAIKKNVLENLSYNEKSLTKVITQYNTCFGESSTSFQKERKKGTLFNFNLRPGINSTSFNVDRQGGSFDFGYQTNFRFGIESEIIFPFNKNKWTFIVEPTYQSYKASREGQSPFGLLSQDSSIDYKSIELVTGLRHYFYLNQNLKLFVNASYSLFSVNLNSTVRFTRTEFKIEPSGNFVFGGGLKYNRYSLEIRYLADKELIRNFLFIDSTYKGASLVFGYTLF